METEQGKLFMLLGEMSSDIKSILRKSTEQDDRLNAHSERISNLEQFKWRLMGIVTATSAIVGTAISLLTKFL
jgi:hypothetical protein